MLDKMVKYTLQYLVRFSKIFLDYFDAVGSSDGGDVVGVVASIGGGFGGGGGDVVGDSGGSCSVPVVVCVRR